MIRWRIALDGERIAGTWRKGGNLVTDAQLVWRKVLEVRRRIKRHFLIASAWITVADQLHRKGFKACLYSSWNLAAIHCARLEHKGLWRRFSGTFLPQHWGRKIHSALQQNHTGTLCRWFDVDLKCYSVAIHQLGHCKWSTFMIKRAQPKLSLRRHLQCKFVKLIYTIKCTLICWLMTDWCSRTRLATFLIY